MKELLSRPWRRWEVNIQGDLKKTVLKNAECIYLAHNSDKWLSVCIQ